MKKVLVNLRLKESVSLLIDVDENDENYKTTAREKALEELRTSFHSEYYRAFLKNGTQKWEVINCPTPINMEKK